MKKIVLASAIALTSFASAASAGSVAYVAPAEPMMVDEAAPMGSSASWIIPLVAIGLIALVISQDEEDPA